MKQSMLIGCAFVFLSAFPMLAAGQESSKRTSKSAAVAGKAAPRPPAVGTVAPDFELPNLKGETIALKQLNEQGPLVLLVLRGWPGYQCPLCTRQVGEFLSKKGEFAKYGVRLVMIYPGPGNLLAEHAKEFSAKVTFPENYHLLIDPDYKFTNAWGLRWEAERETAYPSTFIVNRSGRIAYGVTSTSHGGRASAEAVLAELERLK